MMDALDVMSQYPFEQTVEVWHRLLNCGFRCAISAGTDTFNNNMYALVIGSNRVYARVTPPLTYEKWIEAFKRGRSFATNGPLLSLTINGAEPGEEVRLPAGPASVQVQARAFSLAPMDQLDVLANGEVVHSVAASGDRSTLEASCSITLRNSAWVAVRATGPAHRLVPNGLGVLRAHQSRLLSGWRPEDRILHGCQVLRRLDQPADCEGPQHRRLFEYGPARGSDPAVRARSKGLRADRPGPARLRGIRLQAPTQTVVRTRTHFHRRINP